MREIQLPLSQTQKVRLQKALEQLESLSTKGHGTANLNGEVVATLCGVVVERANKLVYVRALRSRYKPEVGDIVIGRVVEVAQKRWRLEINYNQDAVLLLSSMNMRDGVQEITVFKTLLLLEEGGGQLRFELNMCCIFEENDVACAEVRGFQHDGLHLQARSRKYGKLNRGQLLIVPPYLVKRQKQHFHHLEEFGIDLILGCNGFIWVGEHVEAKDDMVEDQVSQSDPQVLLPNNIVSVLKNKRKLTQYWRQEITYAELLMLLEYCQP
ncbi:Exosome complex component RRP4 [Glycine soja]